MYFLKIVVMIIVLFGFLSSNCFSLSPTSLFKSKKNTREELEAVAIKSLMDKINKDKKLSDFVKGDLKKESQKLLRDYETEAIMFKSFYDDNYHINLPLAIVKKVILRIYPRATLPSRAMRFPSLDSSVSSALGSSSLSSLFASLLGGSEFGAGLFSSNEHVKLTSADGNCFFHAVFGEENQLGSFVDVDAHQKRLNFVKFLERFQILRRVDVSRWDLAANNNQTPGEVLAGYLETELNRFDAGENVPKWVKEFANKSKFLGSWWSFISEKAKKADDRKNSLRQQVLRSLLEKMEQKENAGCEILADILYEIFKEDNQKEKFFKQELEGRTRIDFKTLSKEQILGKLKTDSNLVGFIFSLIKTPARDEHGVDRPIIAPYFQNRLTAKFLIYCDIVLRDYPDHPLFIRYKNFKDGSDIKREAILDNPYVLIRYLQHLERQDYDIATPEANILAYLHGVKINVWRGSEAEGYAIEETYNPRGAREINIYHEGVHYSHFVPPVSGASVKPAAMSASVTPVLTTPAARPVLLSPAAAARPVSVPVVGPVIILGLSQADLTEIINILSRLEEGGILLRLSLSMRILPKLERLAIKYRNTPVATIIERIQYIALNSQQGSLVVDQAFIQPILHEEFEGAKFLHRFKGSVLTMAVSLMKDELKDKKQVLDVNDRLKGIEEDVNGFKERNKKDATAQEKADSLLAAINELKRTIQANIAKFENQEAIERVRAELLLLPISPDVPLFDMDSLLNTKSKIDAYNLSVCIAGDKNATGGNYLCTLKEQEHAMGFMQESKPEMISLDPAITGNLQNVFEQIKGLLNNPENQKALRVIFGLRPDESVESLFENTEVYVRENMKNLSKYENGNIYISTRLLNSPNAFFVEILGEMLFKAYYTKISQTELPEEARIELEKNMCALRTLLLTQANYSTERIVEFYRGIAEFETADLRDFGSVDYVKFLNYMQTSVVSKIAELKARINRGNMTINDFMPILSDVPVNSGEKTATLGHVMEEYVKNFAWAA